MIKEDTRTLRRLYYKFPETQNDQNGTYYFYYDEVGRVP